MFESILAENSSITLAAAAACTLVSLLLGLIAALVYMYRNTYTKNFVVTLALLPTMVQIVIMLVNGNLGTGVAVLGAFSLVRFRSVPGSAREIGSIFFAMAIGLATGMGYLAFAAGFVLLIGAALLALFSSPFGRARAEERSLKITIPETLDYTDLFSDLFEKYTGAAAFQGVRTTNMGSLYELHYRISLRDIAEEKAFLDEIRCRNGNLNIVCSHAAANREEL